MSRLIGELIKVHQDKASMVTAFIWRKRLYRVKEILDWWREPSAWWDEEEMRLFFRVNAGNSSGGIYELCKIGEEWFISKVLD